MAAGGFGSLATYLLNTNRDAAEDPYRQAGAFPSRPERFDPGPRMSLGELALLIAGAVGPQIAQRSVPKFRRDPGQAMGQSIGAASNVLGLSRERRAGNVARQERAYEGAVGDWLTRFRAGSERADQGRSRTKERRESVLFGPRLRGEEAAASEAETSARYAEPGAEARIRASGALADARTAGVDLKRTALAIQRSREARLAATARIQQTRGALTPKDLWSEVNRLRKERRDIEGGFDEDARAATQIPPYPKYEDALGQVEAEAKRALAEIATDEQAYLAQLEALTAGGGAAGAGAGAGAPLPGPRIENVPQGGDTLYDAAAAQIEKMFGLKKAPPAGGR